MTTLLALMFALSACLVGTFGAPKIGDGVSTTATVMAIGFWVALVGVLAATSVVMMRGWP